MYYFYSTIHIIAHVVIIFKLKLFKRQKNEKCEDISGIKKTIICRNIRQFDSKNDSPNDQKYCRLLFDQFPDSRVDILMARLMVFNATLNNVTVISW